MGILFDALTLTLTLALALAPTLTLPRVLCYSRPEGLASSARR
jgi:hypothetical protein